MFTFLGIRFDFSQDFFFGIFQIIRGVFTVSLEFSEIFVEIFSMKPLYTPKRNCNEFSPMSNRLQFTFLFFSFQILQHDIHRRSTISPNKRHRRVRGVFEFQLLARTRSGPGHRSRSIHFVATTGGNGKSESLRQLQHTHTKRLDTKMKCLLKPFNGVALS